MTKLGIALVALVVVALAAWWVREASLSDEERIQRHLHTMAAGFDEGDVGDCIGPLASDFTAARTGVERDDVRRGLIGFFLRDRAAGARLHHVELGDPTIVVGPEGEDPRAAQVVVEATFLRRSPGGQFAEVVWRVSFDAQLEERGDWQIVSAEARTLEGRPLR